jgi:hypothetical protein
MPLERAEERHRKTVQASRSLAVVARLETLDGLGCGSLPETEELP